MSGNYSLLGRLKRAKETVSTSLAAKFNGVANPVSSVEIERGIKDWVIRVTLTRDLTKDERRNLDYRVDGFRIQYEVNIHP